MGAALHGATLVRPLLLPLLLLAPLLVAAGLYQKRQRFENPIAFSFAHGRLFVLERGNRLLTLALDAEGGMELPHRRRIETDDDAHYIVRQLYPGRDGVVAQSRMYSRDKRTLFGYRLRAYPLGGGPPRDVSTIHLEHPEQFPEVRYLLTDDGRQYLVNGCEGQQRFWQLPSQSVAPDSGRATGSEPGRGLVMSGGHVPRGVVASGRVDPGSVYWSDIELGPGDHL